MAKDAMDQMLEDIDKGKKAPSTLKDARQTVPSQPLPRPGGVYTQPEGPRGGQIKYKDYAPKDVSPHGDLGKLSAVEMKALFPKMVKGGTDYVSSKHLPMGKVRVECDDSPMKPLMKAGSPVYPEYCLPDHSGVNAGSMVGGHGKNARGTAAMISQPAAVKQKGNSKHPIVNKRVKNV
jgi:hypothetical protein